MKNKINAQRLLTDRPSNVSIFNAGQNTYLLVRSILTADQQSLVHMSLLGLV